MRKLAQPCHPHTMHVSHHACRTPTCTRCRLHRSRRLQTDPNTHTQQHTTHDNGAR
jgi:hypothetical protein